MTVYAVIEEQDQNDFYNSSGYQAASYTRLVNIYETREHAEQDLKEFIKESLEEMDKYETDPRYYYIEEKVLL